MKAAMQPGPISPSTAVCIWADPAFCRGIKKGQTANVVAPFVFFEFGKEKILYYPPGDIAIISPQVLIIATNDKITSKSN